jgi:GT2 family glycosyltransferase
MSFMSPRVSIIILNWNGWRDTVECVESSLKVTYPNYEILIVDNGSTDESVAELRARFPKVPMLCLPENRYYAGGNNAGIRHALAAGADYIMLLNNDTVVHPDFLNPLVDAMEEDPTLAAVGGTLYYDRNFTVIQTAGAYLDLRTGKVFTMGNGEKEVGQYGQKREVDYICGAAILMRSEAFRQIGLLDEKLKLYSEESDWCLRAMKNGFKILFVPNSRVFHKGSVSSNSIRPLAMYLIIRNKIWLIKRHATLRQRIDFHCSGFFFYYPKLIFGRLVKKEYNLFLPTLNGFLEGYVKYQA